MILSIFIANDRLVRRYILVTLFILSTISCIVLNHTYSLAQTEDRLLQTNQTSSILACQANQGLNQTTSSHQLVQQGVEQYQQECYQQAIALWQAALARYQEDEQRQERAVILENLARVYQRIGRINESIGQWEQAANIYQQLAVRYPASDYRRQQGRMLTERAQAHILIGQYRRAIDLLCNDLGDDSSNQELSCDAESALAIAQSQNSSKLEIFGGLGEAHRLLGNFDLAERYLQKGLNLTEVTQNRTLRPTLIHSLGNVKVSQALQDYQKSRSAKEIGYEGESKKYEEDARERDKSALADFQLSFKEQPDKVGKVRSLLASISVNYRLSYSSPKLHISPEQLLSYESAARENIVQALTLLNEVPNSRDKVYFFIDLSHFLQASSKTAFLPPSFCFEVPESTRSQSEDLLWKAAAIAETLQDVRSKSFAVGELGHLYECREQYAKALELTQSARQLADSEVDARYLWEWQTARIFQKSSPDKEQAIGAYKTAIQTLEKGRSDILNAKRDSQFDFRDFVEPLYRQFIELQLSLEKPFTLISASQTNFDTALKTLDALRLAELQNYFGNNCQLILSPLSFNSQSTRSTNQNTTAIFSSVIFDKKTAIVVQYPNGNKQLNWINEEKGEIIETLADFRNRLGDASNADSQEHYYFGNAKQIYQWVITPFREQLQAAGVDTLVFIQDGIFRNIPMAALYDDNSQFLVQNYTIVTAPSVSISESKPFDWKTSRVLALGLSGSVVEVGGRKLDPLDGVKREIESLREVFPDNGNNTLENSNFTRKRMQERLAQRSYQIIQIGTHANFGTDSQNTYLVMGDGTRLQINELNQILRSAAQENPFELMVLTACKTADGNDRVVLGLAGVAAQTGTRRVLATLWSVEDDSTSTLISQFYKDLYNTGMSPAEVLQQAQKHLLNEDDPKLKKYKHPYYWAPYILIGDWR